MIDTRFNSNYASNLLIGKEWQMGKPEKGRVFGVSSKVMLLGGKRFTPILLEESRAEDSTVRDWDNRPWGVKGDDVFQLNLALSLRRDKKKSTRELKLDIQNVTNNQAVTNQWYDADAPDEIEESYQLSLIPVLSYKIEF